MTSDVVTLHTLHTLHCITLDSDQNVIYTKYW